MFSPTKRIFAKYKSLIVHMFDEQATNTLAKTNLDLLCNVEIILGLTCILPLFNACNLFQSLFKLEMFSFVISLMQLRLVKGIYLGCMLI